MKKQKKAIILISVLVLLTVGAVFFVYLLANQSINENEINGSKNQPIIGNQTKADYPDYSTFEQLIDKPDSIIYGEIISREKRKIDIGDSLVLDYNVYKVKVNEVIKSRRTKAGDVIEVKVMADESDEDRTFKFENGNGYILFLSEYSSGTPASLINPYQGALLVKDDGTVVPDAMNTVFANDASVQEIFGKMTSELKKDDIVNVLTEKLSYSLESSANQLTVENEIKADYPHYSTLAEIFNTPDTIVYGEIISSEIQKIDIGAVGTDSSLIVDCEVYKVQVNEVIKSGLTKAGDVIEVTIAPDGPPARRSFEFENGNSYIFFLMEFDGTPHIRAALINLYQGALLVKDDGTVVPDAMNTVFANDNSVQEIFGKMTSELKKDDIVNVLTEKLSGSSLPG
ncbi:MAG: hypothetical protein LBR54_00915 [Oscillospiraceae bacterium]|jgi:glutaredoxin 2|nr:hypothetical protein [Oscillospiraceae bacterium]